MDREIEVVAALIGLPDGGRGGHIGGVAGELDPVGEQIRQRAGLVFMRVGEEQIARRANLFGQQMRQFVPAIAALIAAIHDERRGFALHKITVALLGARLARQI